MDLKGFIVTYLINKKGQFNNRLVNKTILLNKFPEFYNKLLKVTFFLETEYLPERLYAVMHNIKETPKCYCGKLVKFSKNRKRFNYFCSSFCKKSKAEYLKRIKKASFEKFGTDNPAKNEKVICKIKNTCLKRYGVENPLSSKNIRQKCKDTLFKKYGVTNPMQVPKFKNKFFENYKKKTGYSSLSANPEIIKKRINNSIKRHSCPSPTQKNLSLEFKRLLQNEDELKKLLYYKHYTENKSLTLIGKDLEVSPYLISDYFKKYSIPVRTFYQSQYEIELFNFIKSIYKGTILTGNRNTIPPNELDIYIPDKNIAIEFHGLYWHSYDRVETIKEKNKHYIKTLKCKELGIRLFSIFENEWINPIQCEIWKNIIGKNLGVIPKKIYARKCLIQQITKNQVKTFYDKNHLQGYVRASYHFGLFYENQLISAMSFIRYKNVYELNRFCTKLNYSIIGGASKLFKYFLVNYHPNKIISFSDFRYSYGDIYKILGFNQVSTIGPRYYYVRQGKIFHRRNFQKQYLKKVLKENYNEFLTESQMIFNFTDYRRIWDCGKLKFEYINKET